MVDLVFVMVFVLLFLFGLLPLLLFLVVVVGVVVVVAAVVVGGGGAALAPSSLSSVFVGRRRLHITLSSVFVGWTRKQICQQLTYLKSNMSDADIFQVKSVSA